MIKEGLIIRTGVNIGKDISGKELLEQFDAICIAIGCSTSPRSDRLKEGILMESIMQWIFLPFRTGLMQDIYMHLIIHINAEGKKVLVIGGGDTGSDCVGTSIRQKAVSVTQIEILPKPPFTRTDDNPWPYFGKILKDIHFP